MTNNRRHSSWAAAPLVVLGLVLTAAAGDPRQEVRLGLIQGRVLNEEGVPIPGAQVWAFPKGENPMSFREPFAQADGNGNFAFKDVRPGVYMMHASKVEDGFPDNLWDFYGGAENDRITVRSGATSTITIHLAKAGTLTLRVVDAKTHKPIRAVSVGIHRLHHRPNEFSTGLPTLGGSFSVLVPASVPIEVDVWTDGYEKWSYTRAHPRRKFIELGSGASKLIQVALNPKS